MAVTRVAEGESPREVARSFGYNRSSVYPWLHAVQESGSRALAAHKQTGRPRKLSPQQEGQVPQLLDGHTPLEHGLAGMLWTRSLVAEVVRQQFGVHLSAMSIGRLLKRQGLSFQHPLRRAYERDPEVVKEWKEQTLPELQKHAREQGMDLFFLDEAGVRGDVAPQKTWAPKGRRPEVSTQSRRESINAISAVEPHGAFWFRTYRGSLNALTFIAFLLAFLLTRDKPVLLVLDSHPAHTGAVVQKLVAMLRGVLEVHFLPPYAPDLNPDEFVWGHLKGHGLARRPLRQGERLADRVQEELASMGGNPGLIRSFFRAPSVGSFTDF